MTFTWPAMLYALLLMLPLAWLYLRLRKARQQVPGQISLSLAAPETAPGKIGLWASPALLAAGLVVLLVGLARPQAVVTLPRIEGTAILAFDVSGSMAADDYAPTRMEAAKVAAQAFVEGQPSDVLVGVVAFSDGGFAIQEPTADREAILSAINRLRPESGTSLANGILASLQVLAPGFDRSDENGEAPSEPEAAFSPGTATVILLTDGENNLDPDPMEAARTAAELGVRVHTIGVGSPEGSLLEIEGFIVHTSLDEATLQAIAEISGGTYFHAGDETDLEEIYRQIEPELVVKTEEMEVTALFAGLGVLLLLGGGLVSLFETGRMP